MTAHHTISQRPATAEEQAQIETSPMRVAVGCGGLVFGSLPVVVAAYIGGVLLGWLPEPDAVGWLILIGALVLTIALAVGMTLFYTRFMRRMLEPHRRDAEAGMVEVIEVAGARVVAIEPSDPDDRVAMAFDIGDGKLLYLAGEWLWDRDIYGAPASVETGEDDSTSANGLAPPYRFPSEAFTLVRAPRSGDVLSLRVTGPPLALGDEQDVLPDYGIAGDSLIFHGTLETLHASISRAAREQGRDLVNRLRG